MVIRGNAGSLTAEEVCCIFFLLGGIGLEVRALRLQALLRVPQLATALGPGVLVGLLDRLELRIYLLKEKVRCLLLKNHFWWWHPVCQRSCAV